MGTRGIDAALTLKLIGTLTNDLEDSPKTPEHEVELLIRPDDIQTGTGENQGNRLWEREFEIPGGTSHTVDIYDFSNQDVGAGLGNDMLGQALSLAEIVVFIIYNQGPGRLKVEPGSPNPFSAWGTDRLPDGISPGGFDAFYMPSEDAQDVDSLSANLKLTALHADCEAHLVILGRAADDQSESSQSESQSSQSA